MVVVVVVVVVVAAEMTQRLFQLLLSVRQLSNFISLIGWCI